MENYKYIRPSSIFKNYSHLNLRPISIRTKTIELADWCARELWRGYKYNNGLITISDDCLLYKFSTSIKKYQYKITKAINLKDSDVNELMTATQIKLRSYKKFSIRKGIRILSYRIDNYYSWYFQNFRNDRDFHILMPCFVYEVGKDFYNGVTKNPQNGCYGAFASRLLFFAAPELPIFNYSLELAKSLGLKSILPVNNLEIYYDIVAAEYINHWGKLVNYQMPLSRYLDDNSWLLIKESGWWQRRIFDIALLLHFKLFDASQFIFDIPNTPNRKYF